MEAKHETVPPRHRDDDTGRYTEEYPAEAFLDAIRTLDGGGTGEIAEEVGCDRRTAYVKLTALRDAGKVSSRKIGQTLFWSAEGAEGAEADHRDVEDA